MAAVNKVLVFESIGSNAHNVRKKMRLYRCISHERGTRLRANNTFHGSLVPIRSTTPTGKLVPHSLEQCRAAQLVEFFLCGATLTFATLHCTQSLARFARGSQSSEATFIGISPLPGLQVPL